jgi:hypothetical protein
MSGFRVVVLCASAIAFGAVGGLFAQGESSKVWTDAATGQPIPMWDLWLDDATYPETHRRGLRPLSDNPELQPLIELAKPLERDQFEKSEDFELRKRTQEAKVQGLLSRPALLPAVRDTGRHADGFIYDADKEVIDALLPMDNEHAGFSQLSVAYDRLVLRIPDTAIRSAVTKHFKGNPVSITTAMTSLNFSCGFPLPLAEAKAGIKNLSALYSVRAQSTATTTVPREAVGTMPNRTAPGILPDRIVRASIAADVVVFPSDLTSIDVWLVDRVRRQRIAVMPLSQCSLAMR